TAPGVTARAASVGEPGARVKNTGAVSTAPLITNDGGQSAKLETSSAAGSARPSPGTGNGGPQAAVGAPSPSRYETLGKASAGPKGWLTNTSAACSPPAAWQLTFGGGGGKTAPADIGSTEKRTWKPNPGPGGRTPNEMPLTTSPGTSPSAAAGMPTPGAAIGPGTGGTAGAS